MKIIIAARINWIINQFQLNLLLLLIPLLFIRLVNWCWRTCCCCWLLLLTQPLLLPLYSAIAEIIAKPDSKIAAAAACSKTVFQLSNCCWRRSWRSCCWIGNCWLTQSIAKLLELVAVKIWIVGCCCCHCCWLLPLAAMCRLNLN